MVFFIIWCLNYFKIIRNRALTRCHLVTWAKAQTTTSTQPMTRTQPTTINKEFLINNAKLQTPSFEASNRGTLQIAKIDQIYYTQLIKTKNKNAKLQILLKFTTHK